MSEYLSLLDDLILILYLASVKCWIIAKKSKSIWWCLVLLGRQFYVVLLITLIA